MRLTAERPAAPARDGAPVALRTLAAVVWRLLVVAAGVWLLAALAMRLMIVIVPIVVALALTALLKPLADWMAARGAPRLAATFAVMVGFVLLIAGIAVYIVPNFVAELSQLQSQLVGTLERARTWLTQGPLSISAQQLDDLRQQFLQLGPFGSGQGSGSTSTAAVAVRGAMLVLKTVAGVLLTLLLTFFFVKDGDDMVAWLVGQLDDDQQPTMRLMGAAAWGTFAAWLRGRAVVSLFNAVASFIAYSIIGIPLVLALAVLEFVLSFIPLVGALLAGGIAALVALSAGGLSKALLVVAVAVVIEQLEGNVFEPYVVGRTVNVHPAIVAIAAAIGAVLAGIIGALLAVPITATTAAAIGAFRSRRDHAATKPADLDD